VQPRQLGAFTLDLGPLAFEPGVQPLKLGTLVFTASHPTQRSVLVLTRRLLVRLSCSQIASLRVGIQ
jgi:hypothetical protein